MNVAQAQVILPAVTEQLEGPWSRDNSEHEKARQRQAFELDFNSYYDENIKQPVAAIAAVSKPKMPVGNKLFWALLAVFIIGGFGIGLVGPDKIKNLVTSPIFFPLFLGIVLQCLFRNRFSLFNYRAFFTSKRERRTARSEQLGSVIIPEIFRFLNNGCQFNRTPSLTVFDENFLGINSSKDRYHCQDAVTGSHNGVTFKMMEVEIEKEEKNPNTNTSHYVTVFNGVYILLDVPKPFTGRVDIKRDSDKFFRAVTNAFSSMKRVRLEDPEFEKVFQVYSDNQIEARYLLTTTMMQSLNQLRFLLGGSSLEASFNNRKLALRIDCPYDLFEIDCGLREEEYREEAKKIIGDLNSIFKAIDTMDLKQQGVV